MNVIFEEDGSFKVGTILSDNETSLQVETASGKRSKVKASNVVLRFERASINDFMATAQHMAEEIDIDFLWECCGESEFGFLDLGADYFGHTPSPHESVAVLLRLHGAPMYFYRKGKGRYKAAPADTLQAALAGIERKKREAEQIEQWIETLKTGQLPPEVAQHSRALLHKPDKNSMPWKALAAAAEAMQLSPLRLLERCGAIPSVENYFLDGFIAEYFPKGLGFGNYPAPADAPELPVADVSAFSIDDAATTEIDDAFSVTKLENGGYKIGVHIAAPTFGIPADSPLEQIVLSRLSTVYMPGNKITMLPDEVVERFTLAADHTCPALSLYLTLDQDLEITGTHSQAELVHIAANLRHDAIEPFFNEATVDQEGGRDYPYRDELTLLWRLGNKLEERRGKADPNRVERLDYSFHIDPQDDGSKRVRIVPRKRGSPMDKLVAELMIFVNSEWGKMLGEAGIPGIYRAQTAGKVRMTTTPSPHQGLGVAQYAWSSSPLRRAVDFINQQQLIAMLSGSKPRYAKNDAMLFAAMREFDAA